MFNILEFLPAPPDTSLIYEGSYSPIWVIISVLVAISASYAALSASAQSRHLHNTTSRLTWALISAFTLGVGIWAMHFIGMLAFSLPHGIQYDPVITLISMVPAILASGVALDLAWHGGKRLSIGVRSVLLGAGIGTMHYTGMAAMRLDGFVRYDPSLVALSIFVAVALAYLALRVKSGVVRLKKWHDVLVAVIMGCAVSGMHYTAMSAAYFVRGDVAALPSSVFTANTLAIAVALATAFLALGALALAAIARNREMTDQLRDSEERWKFALDGAGDGVWDWNPQTDTCFFSKRWKEMLGYAENEFGATGTAWLEHLHPDDKGRLRTVLREYFEGGRATVEFRVRCKDGSWKWIMSRGKLISRDGDGKALRLIGTNTDITERKHVETELLRFKDVLDNTLDMIFMFEPTSLRFVYVNQGALLSMGYSREELHGMTPYQIKPLIPEPKFRQLIAPLLSGEQTALRFDTVHRRKDGTDFQVAVFLQLVTQSDGSGLFVAIVRDITARKRAEEELQQRTGELQSQQDELRQSTDRLRDSEERWKFALDGAGDGVWDWNPQTDTCFFSKRWKEMLGYAENEFGDTGTAWVENLHPDDKDHALTNLQKYLAGDLLRYVIEFRMRCKDGSWKWILARAKLTGRDGDGNPLRLIGTHTDITERRHIEQREHSRNQVLGMLAKGASLTEILHSIVRGLEQEDPTMLCSILLMDREGKHLLNGAAPSLPDFYNEAIHGIEIGSGVGSCGTAAFTGERVIVEDIKTHPYWKPYKELAVKASLLSCWSEPIKSATGKVLGTFAIYHHEASTPADNDIQLIEQFASLAGIAIEQSSSNEELKLAAMVYQNSSEAMSVTDANDIIITVNSAFTEVTGYSLEEIIGKNASMLNSGRHDEAFHQAMWHEINTTGQWRGEAWDRRKDGVVYVAWRSISNIYNEDGSVHRRVSLFSDITERKRVQEELRQSHEELEENNKQLQAITEELHSQQEELRQSNEELEEKNQLLAGQKLEVEYKNREIEAAKLTLVEKAEQLALTSKYKSEFLSSMSHELRTPLNSLLILAQLLAENPEHTMSEQQIEYAKIIQGAGKDLLELINDILDLSKIESGTVTPDLQDVSFANVHEQVERGFRHVAQSRDLGFGVELAPGLPPSLYTDSQRLQQVLRNLLSNAFKFIEKGQVSVRIAPVESGWSVDHDGLNRAQTVIGFFVTDSGIGLLADKQKIIFEAFQQADTGTARKYGGTGLGLSISREIAWLLGGEVRLVESEPGKGSTFVLYLPLRAPESGQGRTSFTPETTQRTPAAQEGAQETNPQPTAVADDRAAIKPGERTLLIIEDDTVFAGILLRAARDKGFKGIVAARGDDGLKLASEFTPTAITLDLHLPDMDGWVVLERLKRNPDTRHIPVDIISAEDNRPRGLRSGALEYMVKPVTAESLQKALVDMNKFAEREVKDLLVADGDEQHRNTVLDLIGSGDVRIKAVASGKDALAALKKKRYDCIVLNINLPDIPVADLLEAIQGFALTRDVPVIVCGMDELPQQEQKRLKSLALKGIVKEVRTPERLLDETALFLHRVVSKLPEERRQMLEKLYLSADSLAGKKVLVVDDDMRNIFALTAVLERHKMVVLSAENGRAALEELEKNPDVDIVLMDIMMPEMDGYEAMRQIRQKKQFESLPMIALTAKAMKGDREKCTEAGASDYVSKPVDTDQLLSLLRVWLYK